MSPLASPSVGTLALSSCFLQQQLQTRSVWQEVLRAIRDPNDPTKIRFEDPEVMANRSGVAQSAEGLLKRRKRYYEKPWMKRKRLKEMRAYNGKRRIVNDLTNYIQFQRDYFDKKKGK